MLANIFLTFLKYCLGLISGRKKKVAQTKRARKSRQKRTYKKRAEVRKANTTARAKARSQRTQEKVDEDKEQDRIQKQVARDQKRKELVLVETVDGEDDDYSSLSAGGTEKNKQR